MYFAYYVLHLYYEVAIFRAGVAEVYFGYCVLHLYYKVAIFRAG